MNIEYDRTIHVPAPGEWSAESIGDWLHPCHGPVPDICGAVYCDGEMFVVALWATPDAVLAALELVWEDDPDPDAPIAEPPMRGVILQSYRWTIDEGELRCCNRRFPLPIDKEDSAWRNNIYKLIMKESVRLTVTMTVGNAQLAPASALASTSVPGLRKNRTTSGKRRSR